MVIQENSQFQGLTGDDIESYNTPQKMQWEESGNLKQAALGGQVCVTKVFSIYFKILKKKCIAFQHTLLLTNSGKVYSCGNNELGQLGQETSRKRPRMLQFRM